MNFYTYNQENGKKYTVVTAKSDGRTREEFARGFIKSYDGALKKIMRRERGKDAMEFIKELKNELEKEE